MTRTGVRVKDLRDIKVFKVLKDFGVFDGFSDNLRGLNML